MLRVHIPPLPPNAYRYLGELKNILIDGVEMHPHTQLSGPERAHMILLDKRHLQSGLFRPEWSKKSVFFDYDDSFTKLYDVPVAHYFKRSMIKKELNGRYKLYRYQREVKPIAYSLRRSFMINAQRPQKSEKRDIDVACFFDPSDEQNFNVNRIRVARWLEKSPELEPYNVFIGNVGNKRAQGRNFFQVDYFNALQRSKIVIHCNPFPWEGDYRFFEAIAGGALVFSDAMGLPIKKPFIDQFHLMYYGLVSERNLLQKLSYFLTHEEDRLTLAQNGYDHAFSYHRPQDRIQEAIEALFGESMSRLMPESSS